MGKIATKAAPRKAKAKAPEAEPREDQPEGDILDSAVSLADVQERLNGLWYGPWGTGKTSAIATMANLGPMVMINAEAGLKRKPLQRLGINTDNIRVIPDPDAGQELTYSMLEDVFWALANRLVDDPDYVVGTAWDSVTEIHKKLLDQVVDHQYQKAQRGGKDRDQFFIDRADYGVMTEQMRLLMRRFRDLPCHFAVTALERREKDDDGAVLYQPAVTPALQNELGGWMDIVVHTETAEIGGVEEYRGQLRNIGKYQGKDRWSATPRKLVDPTFERILGYINDEITVADDPVMIEAKERRTAEAKAGSGKNSGEQDDVDDDAE